MTRLGMRVANVALFVLSTFLGARLINQFSAAVLTSDPGATAAVSARPAAAARSWQERSPILDRNLFGAAVGMAPPASDTASEESLQSTKLPLRLLGTVASKDPVVARASIEDNATKRHQVVRIGDTLTGQASVSVLRIERRRVVLQNGNRREELTLDEGEAATGSVASSTKAPPKRPRRDRAAAPAPDGAVDSTGADLLRQARERKELVDAATQGPTAFDQARVLPKFEGGQMVGIELSKIAPDSFYDKLGLSDGDVVTELNGIKIDHPSRSKELLEAFTNGQPLTATVISAGGGSRTVTAGPELMGEIGLGGAIP